MLQMINSLVDVRFCNTPAELFEYDTFKNMEAIYINFYMLEEIPYLEKSPRVITT